MFANRAVMRRRQLVLDVSKVKRPVTRAEMRELTPALATAYAGRTSKTLSRDLNAARDELGLLRTMTFRDDRKRIRVGGSRRGS